MINPEREKKTQQDFAAGECGGTDCKHVID